MISCYTILGGAARAETETQGAYGQSPYSHYGFQKVLLKHNLNYKGWNSHIHRGFPGKFESSNLSRDKSQ